MISPLTDDQPTQALSRVYCGNHDGSKQPTIGLSHKSDPQWTVGTHTTSTYLNFHQFNLFQPSFGPAQTTVPECTSPQKPLSANPFAQPLLILRHLPNFVRVCNTDSTLYVPHRLLATNYSIPQSQSRARSRNDPFGV